jgi:hypothetical protein
MSTEKQIAANRRNALKSTGPSSEEGKTVSRFNAVRHGLRAQSDRVSIGNLDELRQIQRDFHQSFQPQNPRQTDWVDDMAFARWQLLRWQRAETQELNEPTHTDPLRQARLLELFSWRQGRHQRAFMKAFERYRRSMRAGQRLPEPPPAP